MIGQRFTRLTVVAFSHRDARWRKHWLCRCDCGAARVVQASLLRTGNTKSCGCWGVHVKTTATRLPAKGGAIYQILLGYRRHARDAGRVFILTREQFTALVLAPCHYCGKEPSNHRVTKNCREGLIYNGIDRIDNTRGYEADNVVSCCRRCNTAKGARWTYEVARARIAHA